MANPRYEDGIRFSNGVVGCWASLIDEAASRSAAGWSEVSEGIVTILGTMPRALSCLHLPG